MVKMLAHCLHAKKSTVKENKMTETISNSNKLKNGLKSSSRKDKNIKVKDGFMHLIIVKEIRIMLQITLSLLIVGCGKPTHPQSGQPVESEIIMISSPDQYWISSIGDVVPATPKWQRVLPILRGLIRNVSGDTLYNRCMRFVIIARDNPDNILSDTIGFFTLDETESIYFPVFPYNIEHDLVPNVNYNIYAVGDTIDYDISITWLYEVVLDD